VVIDANRGYHPGGDWIIVDYKYFAIAVMPSVRDQRITAMIDDNIWKFKISA
jgi:hypothetical protein